MRCDFFRDGRKFMMEKLENFQADFWFHFAAATKGRRRVEWADHLLFCYSFPDRKLFRFNKIIFPTLTKTEKGSFG